jgi:6-phosphogluconolactonase
MAEREIIICRNIAELSRQSAKRFSQLAQKSVESAGRMTVAFSGGSTPKHLYSLLASPDYKNQIRWNNLELFWGDERCVPPDHPESNFRMAQEALLSNIEIPAENIHRMRGERQPQAAAAEYEKELQKFFGLNSGALPRFDLILLGIGEDGHTASLFPGSDALAHDRLSQSHRDHSETETVRLVLAPFVEKLNSHRLSLSLPVLNNAANVWFLVTGASKAGAVKQAFSGSSDLPAARVHPVNGNLIWYITQDAAPGITAPGK